MAGFEVVVVVAEWVEFAQAGVPGVFPRLPVVVFDPGPPATGDGAAGAGPGQREALGGGGSAAEVG
ncbi:MAG TPA: hypothetical protein VJ644_11155, partial [Jiangellaceae bacterium]|nr:hypothetical protein [Jiangellaceae bacterium]